MKRIYSLLLIMAIFDSLSAQQLPHYTQYSWNQFILNPAFSAAHDSSSVRVAYRKQWLGFNGSPETFNVGGFTQFSAKNGISAFVMRDKSGGGYSQLAFNAAYSRSVRVSSNGILSFGIAGWFNQYSFDNSIMQLKQEDDPAFMGGIQRSFIPDASCGIIFIRKKLTIGAGGHQLFTSKLKDIPPISSFQNRLARHYFGHASYDIPLNGDILFKPGLLIKFTDITPVQSEAILIAEWRRILGIGINYRVKDTSSLIIQIRQNNFFVGYSYDLPGGPLRNFQSGSHEITIGYSLLDKSQEFKPQ